MTSLRGRNGMALEALKVIVILSLVRGGTVMYVNFITLLTNVLQIPSLDVRFIFNRAKFKNFCAHYCHLLAHFILSFSLWCRHNLEVYRQIQLVCTYSLDYDHCFLDDVCSVQWSLLYHLLRTCSRQPVKWTPIILVFMSLGSPLSLNVCLISNTDKRTKVV